MINLDKWRIVRIGGIAFELAVLLFLIYSAIITIDSWFRAYCMFGVIALGIVIFGFQTGILTKALIKKKRKK